MQNLTSISIFLLSFFMMVSCATEAPFEEAPTNEDYNFTSVEQVISLDLDKKFEIPEKVYAKFISSMIFMDGRLRGFKYGEIDKVFNDQQSEKFWANFGMSVRNTSVEKREAKPIVAAPRYFGKKPVTGGCAPQLEYVCFGDGPNDIENYKPITGGCVQEQGHVCFSP